MVKKQGILVETIMYVIIFMMISLVVGFLARFTVGFTSDFKTFYVTIDGKDIMTTSGGYKVTPKTPLEVGVNYTFASENTENGYSVKIVANAIKAKDFDFTLDGEVYSFQGEKDLTAGFDIKYEAKSFTVVPKGTNTQEILQAVYPNYIISDCADKGYDNMYSLIVTSYNGEASVIVNFSIANIITDIILDKEAVAF